MTRLIAVFLVLSAASPGSAQQLPSYIKRPPDASGVYAIWPASGVPPSSKTWTWHEQQMQIQFPGSPKPNLIIRNVALPTVTLFKPSAGEANGTAIIVAPGGAFTFLTMDTEGYDVARWLVRQGITAFVLRYRVAHSPENDADMEGLLANLFRVLPHPGPGVETPPVGTEAVEQARTWGEEDGLQAIRFVRQHAAQWGVNPNRIGVVGFSAGGGVVVNAALHFDAESRPDFAAAIYPGYRTASPVPLNVPPLFIALADDDPLVAPISGARLYEAWHAAGKPAELHIFAKGGHGFGMKKQNLPSDEWVHLFKTWLSTLGYLSQKANHSAAHVQTGFSSAKRCR
ncbi:MAG TPA: alpha/beta hydrolase [Terriglobia bacterium]|nr:alpha/beta hydrolase [Terriglobia bacterium]